MSNIDDLARILPELESQLETAELDSAALVDAIKKIGFQLKRYAEGNSCPYISAPAGLEYVLPEIKHVEDRRRTCLYWLKYIYEIINNDFAKDIEKIEYAYKNGYRR